MNLTRKNIVCIGGGTGTFVTLKGLKFYPHNLSAIVTMSDSGGSNKRIRDEFGLLPTSDIRQCLVALSDEKYEAGIMRKLFMYRFEKGRGIKGMTFGNLFMAALSDIVGSQKDAIKKTGQVLRIKGSIIPVSYTPTDLYAKYNNGNLLKEEHLIDEPPHKGSLEITDIFLKPKPQANKDAIEAISAADLVVLGPGDLFTSIIPNLLVNGISESIVKSKAKIVFVMNLMTKYGQTYGFGAKKHLNWLERFIDKRIDFVLINSGILPAEALHIYNKFHEEQVRDDLAQKNYFRIIRKNIVGNKMVIKGKSDVLVRSLIRHDSDKLARELLNILNI